MSDPMDDYLERAKRDLFPKMKESAISLIISGDPDPKLCLELGAAILFDKPIVVVVPGDRKVPANLKRVASAIVQGEMDDPQLKDRLSEAVRNVLRQDERAR